MSNTAILNYLLNSPDWTVNEVTGDFVHDNMGADVFYIIGSSDDSDAPFYLNTVDRETGEPASEQKLLSQVTEIPFYPTAEGVEGEPITEISEQEVSESPLGTSSVETSVQQLLSTENETNGVQATEASIQPCDTKDHEILGSESEIVSEASQIEDSNIEASA